MLSACGGGSKNNSSSLYGPIGVSSGNTRIAATAKARIGSVTQSSRVDGSGTTLDQFELDIRDDGSGGKHLGATLTRNDAENTVLTTIAVPNVFDVVTPSGKIHLSVATNGNVSDDWINANFTKADWKKAEDDSYSRYDADGEVQQFVDQYGAYPIPDSVPFNIEKRPSTILTFEHYIWIPENNQSKYLERPTDNKKLHNYINVDLLDNSINANGDNGIILFFTGYTDLEYVSWGYWMHGNLKIQGSDLKFQSSEAVLGGFADGPNVDAPLSVQGQGSASYSGYASGIGVRNVESRTTPDSPEVMQFNADVNLSVKFDTQSIGGRINGFKQVENFGDVYLDVFGSDGDLQGLVVNLGTTRFDADNGVFESGSTTSNKDASGKWGGQFFGTPARPNTGPPAAGGTWGISQGTEDEDWNLIGGFGTWLDAN